MLIAGFAALLLLALVGPSLAQPGDYHRFADQRTLCQLPMAMDVLSSLAFALAGLAGGAMLWRARRRVGAVERALASLFFTGLLLTGAGSAWYHLAPDAAGLAIDRMAMAVAFAGLLGLAAGGRVSERAGAWLGLTVLLLGPVAAHAAFSTGNVLPWAVLQFGGLAVLLLLALRPASAGRLKVRLTLVLLAYALAKLFELNDQAIFELTGQRISGHTLKHALAALAAVPVIIAFRKSSQSRQGIVKVLQAAP